MPSVPADLAGVDFPLIKGGLDMLYMFRSLFVTGMIVLLLDGPVRAQQIEGLQGEAAKAIATEIRAAGLAGPVEAYVFYGDLSGQGTNDALALLYHPSGGNSDELTKWLFWKEGDGYRRETSSVLDQVVGYEPRNAQLTPGRVKITLTTLRPNDARCCPSGETNYDITLDGGGGPKSVHDEMNQRWTVDQGSGGRVTIKALADDGKTKFAGTCAARGGEPGFWPSLHLDNALLEGSAEPEIIQLEINGRAGIRMFSINARYDEAEKSRIAVKPLGPDFLDAFASGSAMRLIRGSSGDEIAKFGLVGTAKAVAFMRKTCGAGLNVQVAAVELPFVNGRYLSDAALCGLDDGQIVDRIGDEIYDVLYVIEDGLVSGGDSYCEVQAVSRHGQDVLMDAECATDGYEDNVTLKMTYISDGAFRSGDRTFERCD